MKKFALLIILISLISCKTIHNGLSEPKTLQAVSIPAPHYDSLVIKTGWNPPYKVELPFVLAQNTTTSKSTTIRKYTIPVPTKK